MYPQQSNVIGLLYIVYLLNNPNVKIIHQYTLFLYTSSPHNHKSDFSSPFTMPGRGIWRVSGKSADPSEGTYKTNLITLWGGELGAQ